MSIDRGIPPYLGRVCTPSAGPIGTCFQVRPRVFVTAFHVVTRARGIDPDTFLEIDPLAGGNSFRAWVERVDEKHDLAVLRGDGEFDASVAGWGATDQVDIGTSIVVTGVPEVSDPGHAYRALDAPGVWQGRVTRDGVVLGRLTADGVVPGMSGAPVRRQVDDIIVGVVLGRYNSADGRLRNSVWVARCEQIRPMVRDLIDIHFDARQSSRTPPAPRPAGEIVARPELLGPVLELLGSPHARSPTVALVGAGGFGKTTLAGQVYASDVVHRRLADPPLWVTLGEDATGPALASKINELIRHVSSEPSIFTDPEQAGRRLGQLLADQRRLVVIDDVWDQTQLSPFLWGGTHCGRLVTTREWKVVPTGAMTVAVGAMTDAQSAQLVTADSALDPADVHAVLEQAAGWPLLLSLINSEIRSLLRHGFGTHEALERITERLSSDGPIAFDPSRPEHRAQAVSSTIGASLAVLAERDRKQGTDLLNRYLELTVFPGGVDIPQETIENYWRHTGNLSVSNVRRICAELADLSLIHYDAYRKCLQMHAVIREYLGDRASGRLAEFNQGFLDTYRAALPRDSDGKTAWWLLEPSEPYLWSQLRHHLRLATDTAPSGTEELKTVLCDLRWVVAKLQVSDPAAVEADLRAVESSDAIALRYALTDNAHLLGPLKPAHALGATLVSRLDSIPGLQRLKNKYLTTFDHSQLKPFGVLPDLPRPETLKVLQGHSGAVTSLAVSGSGSIVVSGGVDATVRLWNLDDGSSQIWQVADPALRPLIDQTRPLEAVDPFISEIHKLIELNKRMLEDTDISRLGDSLGWVGGPGGVEALVMGHDGSWVAMSTDRGTVRVWDVASGSVRFRLPDSYFALMGGEAAGWFATIDIDSRLELWDPATGGRFCRKRTVGLGVACSRDGRFIFTGGPNGRGGEARSIAIWEVTSRRSRSRPTTFRLHLRRLLKTGSAIPVTASPDGKWLATIYDDKNGIHVWDTESKSLPTILPVDEIDDIQMAAGPNGSWLATADTDGEVTLWDPRGGKPEGRLLGNARGAVRAITCHPNGNWIATGSHDGAIRIWNPSETYREVATERRHSVADIIGGTNTWLATSNGTNTVRLWDADTGTLRRALSHRPASVMSMAADPRGRWLACGCDDGTTWIWDIADALPPAILPKHSYRTTATVAGPNGDWLATGAGDGSIHLWDSTHLTLLATLSGHTQEITAMAATACGNYLVTASADGTARTWRTGDGAPIAVATGDGSALTALSVTKDGRSVIIGSRDGTVQIHSLQDGIRQHVMVGHMAPVLAIANSADGSYLVTTGQDGTARIWNSIDGSLRARLANHQGAVRTVAISPSDRWVATGGDDWTIRIWDAQSGENTTAVRVDGRIMCCRWLSDGRQLYAGGYGGLYAFQYVLSGEETTGDA